MIPSLFKLVKVAFTPIDGCSDEAARWRNGRRFSRTDALLGQGSIPVSRGFVMTSKDVRRMKAKVLAHDFRP